jgi:alpha-beta hydrolase superfamily lysophospholipase
MITLNPEENPRPTPILFVHGAWHGAWCWNEHFLSYFSEHGYTSHAFSLRGHGTSAGAKRFRLTRIKDYVTDLEQIVSQLPKAPILVGHSMGGLVVQKFLETNTAPAGVLLASVPIKGVLRTTFRIARRHPLAFLKANLTWSLYPVIGKPKLTREAFFSKDISPEKLKEYFTRIQDESYLAFLDMLIFNLPNPEKVTTNLLVLGAGDDTIFCTDEVEKTARAYGTEAKIFPDMAHDMMLEPGWQSVADCILEWLKGQNL